MALKTYKPTSKSQRQHTSIDYRKLLSGHKPLKQLMKGKKRMGGRNGQGRITVRHQGGGHKRSMRDVDFKFDKKDIPAKITTIEYDRSAGNFAEVVAQDAGYTHLKMPSTEVRRVIGTCWATIGEVSNEEHRLVNFGKAGRSRWKGIRPTVRGTAMNPVDHPHGGGEGKQGRGIRRAKTMWGKPSGKGQKTRRPKKYSNVFVVTRRKVGKRK